MLRAKYRTKVGLDLLAPDPVSVSLSSPYLIRFDTKTDPKTGQRAVSNPPQRWWWDTIAPKPRVSFGVGKAKVSVFTARRSVPLPPSAGV